MKSFKAEIWAQGPNDAWTAITLPFDVEKAFASKGRVSVKATLESQTFHTSIFPNGDGTHHMMVNKAMKAAAGAGPATPSPSRSKPTRARSQRSRHRSRLR